MFSQIKDVAFVECTSSPSTQYFLCALVPTEKPGVGLKSNSMDVPGVTLPEAASVAPEASASLFQNGFLGSFPPAADVFVGAAIRVPPGVVAAAALA